MNSDLQGSVLAAILKSSYLFQKCEPYIKINLFENEEYRQIYKLVLYHFNKYQSVPNLLSLRGMVDESEFIDDKQKVKQICTDLWEMAPESEDFIISKIAKFVKIQNLKFILSKNLRNLENNDEAIINLGEDIIKSLDIGIESSAEAEVLNLSDPDSFLKFRGQIYGTEDGMNIIKSSFPSVNRALSFGGYKRGDLVMMVAPPGTSKSMTLINEGLNCAKNGYSVMHIFIGDMTVFDGWIRYYSCYTGTPQSTLLAMTPEDQVALVKGQAMVHITDKIHIRSYPAEEVTIDKVLMDLKDYQSRIGELFDVIVIDYPDNLVQDKTNMYLSGGTVYNKMSGFANKNHSVILTASQPKLSYYSSEIIPLESAAESSKKQQNVDLMITFGKPDRSFNYLTAFIAKNRRGIVGEKFRIKTEFECARMHEVSDQEYRIALNSHQKNKGQAVIEELENEGNI